MWDFKEVFVVERCHNELGRVKKERRAADFEHNAHVIVTERGMGFIMVILSMQSRGMHELCCQPR